MENEATVNTTTITQESTETKPEIKVDVKPEPPKDEPVKPETIDEIKKIFSMVASLQTELEQLKNIGSTVPEMKGKLEALEAEKTLADYRRMIAGLPGISPDAVNDFATLHPGLTPEKAIETLQAKPHFMKAVIPGVAGGGSSVERKIDTGNQEGLTPEKRKLIEKRIFG